MQNNSFASERISNLVIPVSYFVGHVKQLKKTKDNLEKYRQASVIGTSGIGKTQLVRTYAYENKNQYNLIWFFDCNLDINQEFVKLVKQLNQKANTGLSEAPKLAKKEVMNYLVHKNKWLLVFDNLKINENNKVKDIVDWEHNGNIIFCSQDSEMLPYTIELTSLHKEDAITLANNLLNSKDKNDVDFLVETFSNYPILIVQGAQLLNQVKVLDKEEYRKKIYQSADKIKLNIELAIKELKPSAVNLLKKIALINNQGFSKELLNIITDDKNTISDDIYQLSKFMLISNVENNDENPIFEMHDVIAQKIAELNRDENDKEYLEDIITRLVNAMPKSTVKAHLFRTAKTISDNMEVILKNVQIYNINLYKVLTLNLQLTVQYVNYLNFYEARKLIEWFNKNDNHKKFKLWLMNNNEKRTYAAYLKIIGGYYSRCSDHTVASIYYTRAKKILEDVHDADSLKFSTFFSLALSSIALGQIQAAQENFQRIEGMFRDQTVNNADISMLLYVKTKLLFAQGKYSESLENNDKTVKACIKNGLQPNDLFLSNLYLLRVELLNFLENYQEAYDQAVQLYKMHKPTKNEDHEIFGRIYTQMARSELGLGNVNQAEGHITKAISIFLADEWRNPKEADYSEDLDLAASYVVQGDIFFAQDNLKQAIASYKRAQVIYFYLYKDNSKNVAHVSYLYTQGAKASCRSKDLYNYKSFGKSQVKEFGVNHPNTVAMFEYCKQYDIDLWAEEN